MQLCFNLNWFMHPVARVSINTVHQHLLRTEVSILIDQLCFVSVHGPRETYFVDEPRISGGTEAVNITSFRN
jgi:hypothetical protein